MSVAQTELVPVPSALPALRLLPAPATEPPYDDEAPQPSASAHPGALRPAHAPLRLVAPLLTPLTAPSLPDADDAWTRPRTPLAALTPAEPFVQALVQRLLEVLAGVRPVTQLQRDTTPDLYARLERLAAAQPRPAGARPATRSVRRVRVQARPEGVAEASATVKKRTAGGVRAVALALRVEGLEGRWCCTDLEGLHGL